MKRKNTLFAAVILVASTVVLGACGGSSDNSGMQESGNDTGADSNSGDESDTEGNTNNDSNTDEAAIAAFGDQLQGVRSYGCTVRGPDQYTTEFVEVFSNGVTTNDVWLYEEPDCVTRPLTFSSALSMQNYTLESPFLTADGREAFKVQFETLQLSSESDDTDFPVGTVLYDILAVEEGGVTQGTSFATTEAERPTELIDAAPATAVGARADTASIDGLKHIWKAACFNGKIQQREFTDQQMIETVEYYNESACERFIATKINTWDVTYGEPVTTVFGLSALRTTTELVDSRLDDIVIDSTLQAPPGLSEIGISFEDIWGVVANELVIGTCLDKRPGNCGSDSNIPDMLNFNVGNRFVKQ